MTELQIDHLESAIGTIALVVKDDGALCALDFTDRTDVMESRLTARFGDTPLRETRDPADHTSRLRAYLEGDLDALATATVAPGGTPFQQRVWQELRRVPAGATRSYAEVAKAIGQPGAARAVGTANSRNPIALAIPCHRIITTNNKLGGYAGGLPRKRWLLTHEGAAPSEASPR